METTVARTCSDAASPASDADLVAALKTMNEDAMEALLRRYGRLIRRIAAGILRDTAEAEDVTQEVFFEVYRKAHLYDPTRGTVRVWLMQYAYHRILRRKAALRLRLAYQSESLDHAELPAPTDRRVLTSEECRWLIRTGLAQLPDRQRLTLELAYLEDLSLRDVATRLNVSLGCARHYYYRGLARLRAWAATNDVLANPEPGTAKRRRSRRKHRVS